MDRPVHSPARPAIGLRAPSSPTSDPYAHSDPRDSARRPSRASGLHAVVPHPDPSRAITRPVRLGLPNLPRLPLAADPAPARAAAAQHSEGAFEFDEAIQRQRAALSWGGETDGPDSRSSTIGIQSSTVVLENDSSSPL